MKRVVHYFMSDTLRIAWVGGFCDDRSRFHRQLLHTPSFLLQRRRFHGEMIPAASAFGSTG
jgi:hypothetical protein